MDKLQRLFNRLQKSVWFFPAILAVPLVTLTILQISGSSAGTIHTLFYGTSANHDLVAGTPRAIRSDEWLVNTQTIISQDQSGYHRINKDIGQGEDVSLNAGIPYKGWSELFRPQNLVFFVLPLANAFAFQWWIVGYLLIVSCYFFILALLPGRRLLAASLASALFFSAFVQWWYTYGTLASLYYPLFIATAVIYLTKQQQRLKKILSGVLIAYLLACFALILYPPFQIATGLALVAFLVGYFWQSYEEWGKRKTLRIIGLLTLCAVFALAIVGLFIITRSSVVQAISHTSYPGQRSSSSGGFNIIHLLSSQLGYQFTSTLHAAQYRIGGVTNQSEASNFLLLSPLLIIPNLILIYKDWRQNRHVDKLLIALTFCFFIFVLHLFLPAFSPIAKVLLLGRVPPARLLVGMGLLNILILVALIRRAEKQPKLYWFTPGLSKVYTLVVLVLELCINLYVHNNSGTFVGVYRAVAFALPLPIIVYLLLRKRFLLAVLLYFAFSFFISFRVNPLYRGLDIITKNPVSEAMVRATKGSDKRWVADSVVTENLAAANGLHSLSGIYYYPQNNLWSTIPYAQYTSYNRYAHATFGFSTIPTAPPQLKLAAQDQIRITTGVCSSYLHREDVGFVLTSQKLTGDCIVHTTQVKLPAASFYIYQLRP